MDRSKLHGYSHRCVIKKRPTDNAITKINCLAEKCIEFVIPLWYDIEKYSKISLEDNLFKLNVSKTT